MDVSLHFSWAGTSGHIITVCLALGGTVRLFPKGLHHVTPQLVRVLPALVLWRCESSHPGACEVGSHCGFDLLFPADDVEHLFLYSPAMCLSSLEKGLFRSFAHFSIVFFAFLLLGCKHSFHILDPTLLSDVWFAKIFSQSLCCLLCQWFLLLCRKFYLM